MDKFWVGIWTSVGGWIASLGFVGSMQAIAAILAVAGGGLALVVKYQQFRLNQREERIKTMQEEALVKQLKGK